MNESNPVEACPLCLKKKYMGRKAQTLYETAVCRKCFFGFINRRQFAFLIDFYLTRFLMLGLIAGASVFYKFPNVEISKFLPGFRLAPWIPGSVDAAALELWFYLSLLFGSFAVLAVKDGFYGHSPGKALMGLQLVKTDTSEPAGFETSFFRNLIVLIPIPLVVALIVSHQMVRNRGYRAGDRMTGTRVIWKKHEGKTPFASYKSRDEENARPLPGERKS